MRKMTTITIFIQEISYLVDHGASYTVDEINQHIEKRDLVDWLEKELPFGSELSLDFSLFKEEHRRYLHDEYDSILGGYQGQERRKWGIENNGLNLLISWGTEIIRDIHGRDNMDEWIEK
ncbi:hypothetical protein SAMN05421743_11466 [Thalassobacillus cyri]|uniref:Uncharacterized protein n=1 Tax=Thalassobacillus cyri TaxID=571932 RepID=A0A1H4G8W5_9BACI|nr:hypothetical protein [Thalassobacillus cyri]SEB05460.1 hypothetical protein SAMN05421743_11466 [Thalassobacillus cyri]